MLATANKTGWENKEYDELVEKANTINNQSERYEMLYKAEEILIDNMPIIPLYTYVRSYQLSPDVKGFNPHILDHHHPKFIYLERDWFRMLAIFIKRILIALLGGHILLLINDESLQDKLSDTYLEKID